MMMCLVLVLVLLLICLIFADDDIFVSNDNIVDAILPDKASCRVDNDYNDNDTY